jgi:branched-chain amino acid transport system ATP-binding protein
MTASLLRVSGLTRLFGGLRAVDGVDLELRQGEIVGLIGPNGAGKTTFVDLLTGGQLPSAGRIEFRGTDITRLGAHERSRMGLARTFQVPRPFIDLTIRENVMVGALFGRADRRVGRVEALRMAERALDRAGLAGMGEASPLELTTAGLKRLEVARCLAAEPDLLFLDEPLGGLNPTEVKDALGLIRTLNEAGMAILFIEHIVPAVMSLSHRVVVLASGRKLAEGTPAEIVAHGEVQRAYLGDVKAAVARSAARRRSRRGASTGAGSP